MQVVIPRLNQKNCITYLNEAFKKLRACESSNDMWYLLLSSSMNCVAENIYWVIRNKPQKLMKYINTRIGEEIIIRSEQYRLKYAKENDFSKIIPFLEKIRKTDNLKQVFKYQKKQAQKLKTKDMFVVKVPC